MKSLDELRKMRDKVMSVRQKAMRFPALLDQLIEVVENNGWQSVKTVPKDGTEFQGWFVTNEGSGFWEPRCRYNEDGNVGIWGRVDYDIDGWDYGLFHLNITHWKPLPPSPEEE